MGISKALTTMLQRIQRLSGHPRDGIRYADRPVASHLMRKLTREDLITIVVEGGTQGIDLSYSILDRENLSHLKFGDRGLKSGVVFKGSSLEFADFSGAILRACNMEDCSLYKANLSYADLSATSLRGAFLRHADFSKASLYQTDLRDADLSGAIFQGADLNETRLEGARLPPHDCFGQGLLQENEQEYRAVLENVVRSMNWDPRMIDFNLRHRLVWAASIYRALANNYSETGQYEDASWAHFKERQLWRRANAPWRSVGVYPFDRVSPDLEPSQHERSRGTLLRQPVFLVRQMVSWMYYLLWEAVCGYGEKPQAALYTSLAIILAFALIFRIPTIGVLILDSATQAAVPLNLRQSLAYSLGTFVTLGFDPYVVRTLQAQVLSGIEGILGVCLLALLLFTTGNKMRR